TTFVCRLEGVGLVFMFTPHPHPQDGETIIPYVDNNLMAKDFQGKVIISSAKIAAYKDRYFFTFDEEVNDYSCLPNFFDSTLQASITGRATTDPSSAIPTSTKNLPSPNKCSCEYENNGCSISFPAPLQKACKCTKVAVFPSCIGTVVSCDQFQPKCIPYDASKEACQLANGNCHG
ncbi:hypothetical protein I4U23_022067, partial [Adineta vaga]